LSCEKLSAFHEPALVLEILVVIQLYASNGCLLLTDWLLTVRNRQFVVYDTGIVYIVLVMVVRPGL
jgi:hypothetical protein